MWGKYTSGYYTVFLCSLLHTAVLTAGTLDTKFTQDSRQDLFDIIMVQKKERISTGTTHIISLIKS